MAFKLPLPLEFLRSTLALMSPEEREEYIRRSTGVAFIEDIANFVTSVANPVVSAITTYRQAESLLAPAPGPVAMLPAETSRRAAARRQYGIALSTPGGYTLGGEIDVYDQQAAEDALRGGRPFRLGYDPYGRRRRMNVLNPRALKRSLRRVKGFAKFAKKVGSFTDPGRAYHYKGFPRRKKKQ